MTSHNIEQFDVERFWTVESLGIKSPSCEGKTPSSEYQKASITREEARADTYTAFPWKIEHAPLPSNFNVCETTSKSIGMTPRQISESSENLWDVIDDQMNRGFIERIEPQENEDAVHYVPHHLVVKNSTTNPLRIVYDCSCRQSPNTQSLNDCLQVGLPHVTDMCLSSYGFARTNLPLRLMSKRPFFMLS